MSMTFSIIEHSLAILAHVSSANARTSILEKTFTIGLCLRCLITVRLPDALDDVADKAREELHLEQCMPSAIASEAIISADISLIG